MRKVIFGYVVLFLLVGCISNEGIVYINSTDDAHCTIDCSHIIKKYWCTQGYGNFGNYCECILLECFKKAPIENKPQDYKEFNIIGVTNSNSVCYKNNVEINCTEV